ncbi:hypothetical protein FRC11_001753 [Ceratobasidium sp. 423]|nr:hypothetical protein FRC11_001753 [Ceratobasidium sp. 423]
MAMEFKDGGFSSFIPAALVYSLPVAGLGLQDNLPSAPARPELIDSCMPRPVRRPSPILLPHHPMDTLWEVDESLDQVPQSRRQLRSVFEDDEEMRSVSFPLPPRGTASIFRSKMASEDSEIRQGNSVKTTRSTAQNTSELRPKENAVLANRE